MQNELQTEYPQYDIQILAVNQTGYGTGSGPSLGGSGGMVRLVTVLVVLDVVLCSPPRGSLDCSPQHGSWVLPWRQSCV